MVAYKCENVSICMYVMYFIVLDIKAGVHNQLK